jgi:hypothetical protein
MKTRITKILGVFMITLLSIFSANSQIYQQQFAVDSASFNSRAMAVGYYINTTPSNTQLTHLGSSAATSTVQVSTGALKIGRTGSGSCYAIRNANFSATSLIYEFDFNITSASGTNSSAISFWLGNGFTNANATPSNLFSAFNIAISSTTGPAWRINNTGTAYTGSRRVLWALNKTGATINYRAPNGSEVSLANNSHDIWVFDIANPSAASKEVNGVTVSGSAQALQNFGFRNGATGSNNNYVFDNMLLDPIPSVPTSSAATSIGSSSFTANWSTVAGVTGYRIDLATDAAFTSMVSGYNNFYVSGQATNSLNITGLGGGTYYYRVRGASQYAVDEIAGGNSASQNLTLTCTTPTINTQPSTGTQTVCVNGSLTALSVAATGATSYQWYSNVTNNNSGGTLIGGATSASYTPSNTSASSLYYYCSVSAGVGCTVASDPSGLITINALPAPTFTAAPSGTVATNTNQTYTTQAVQSNYNWTFSGTLGVDYSIVSGGTSTDNSTVVSWLTGGSKSVTVNYTNSNACSGEIAASTSVTASAAVFYNVASSDVTVLTNWGTNSDGTGTNPANFTDAGQTFNLFNTGATMSTSWDVQGAGTKIVIGNAVTFAATQTFTTSSSAVVDVASNSTLKLSSVTLPTFGTLASSSTVDYAGTSQTVTPTSYSNLTISGSSATLTGTTNISGTFTPGSVTASTSTVVFNGTSSSQVIPAFAYNGLTNAGVDGKSTSGNISVSGLFTMSNSCTIATASTLTYLSTATLSTTAGKTLTVNGTFEDQLNSATFNFGSGAMSIAAGGTFKISGTTGNNVLALTNVTLAAGIGAAGSTLYVAGNANVRLPIAVAGNVVWNTPTATGTSNLFNNASNTIGGNFTIMSTGNGGIVSHGTGGSGRAVTVSGDLIMTGGRYDVSGNPATSANAITVNGNVNLSGTTDTLYASNSTSAGGTGTINIKGNLIHSGGVVGVPSGITNGTFTFNGTTMQDITSWDDYTVVNNKNGFKNGAIVIINNSNGARMLSDVSVAGTLTLTSGKVRTNNFSLVMLGSTSTITGATFGAAATSYIATCDGSGTAVTAGGLIIQNIGSGGRTSTVTFPIGTNTTYNPATLTNAASAVAYTARVNNTPIAGVSPSTDAVKNTWNIQPASGTPSTAIALQWNASDETGTTFTRTAASIAHYDGSAIDVYTSGGAASGANPYTLNPSSYPFTTFGDFGVINGIIIPATEPTVQASGLSITAANTSMTISFTKSTDGSNTVLVVKQGSAVSAAPTDGISYTDGSAVFGSGSNLGSNNYVVYTGTGSSVTVTGLAVGTTYHVAAYSFNGSNGTENYLTASSATGNATTGVPTYYYVGGAGATTNTFSTANMWSTSVNGTPLAGFTPSNSDVFIFDGSNLGGGFGALSTDTATIAVTANTVLGKLVLTNNAKIKLYAASNSITTIGNTANASNTTVFDIPAGSTLKMTGSQNAITLTNNSSASISGNFFLGAGSGITQLLPGVSGSSVTVNNGGYIEFYSGSNNAANTPFGSTGTGVVNFANGSTYKYLKGSDVFGGTGSNVVTFAPNSLCWISSGASSGSSSLHTISGRTFGNFKLDGANFTPANLGSAGFTMYNIDIVTSGSTLTLAETGSNNHIKGNINVVSGATFKLSPAATATCNFSGTSLQTFTINGTWNLGSTIDQSLVISNTAGVSITGAINLSSVAGSSMTVNSGCNLDLASGTLNVAAGTLNLAGTVTRIAGFINGSNTGAIINVTGASSLPSSLFTSSNVRTLTINRSSGVSIGSDLTISTALNLTSGAVDMGANTMIISSAASVNRTNGWVNGNLRKNVASGTAVLRNYEVGDATNYTPVSLTFASVSSNGDVVVKSSTPASTHPNFSTSPINNANYVNRLFTLSNANSITYTSYSTTFNYVAGDKVGAFSESNAVIVKYNSVWTSATATTAAANQNTATGIVGFGALFVGEPCTTVTPSVSISTTSSTICSGSSSTFTALGTNGGPSPVYQWKKNGTDAGSGSSITFLPNTLSNNDVISCVLTANNNCQTTATANSNAIQMTVKQSPSVAQITNGISAITTASLCTLGSTYRYFDATPYGTWSSSNPSVASVTGGSQAGVVTANTNGTATISYNVTATNGCVSTSSVALTVAQQTAPTAISGTNSLCVNATSTLSSTAPIGTTGVWSSSNDRGIISVGGVYTAKNAGTGEARYTVTNASGCKAFAAYAITVNPTPVVPTITYAPGTPNPQAGAPTGSFCVGKVFTVVATPNVPLGAWSATGFASITSLGVVTVNAVGTGSIKYTYTSAAGCVNSRTMVGTGYTCAARGVSVSGEGLVVSGDFTMYPNPAKGYINLNVETLVGKGSIVITDLYGKTVKTQALSMGTNTIDIAKLSKGMYFVSTITSEGKATKKLIVE